MLIDDQKHLSDAVWNTGLMRLLTMINPDTTESDLCRIYFFYFFLFIIFLLESKENVERKGESLYNDHQSKWHWGGKFLKTLLEKEKMLV